LNVYVSLYQTGNIQQGDELS